MNRFKVRTPSLRFEPRPISDSLTTPTNRVPAKATAQLTPSKTAPYCPTSRRKSISPNLNCPIYSTHAPMGHGPKRALSRPTSSEKLKQLNLSRPTYSTHSTSYSPNRAHIESTFTTTSSAIVISFGYGLENPFSPGHLCVQSNPIFPPNPSATEA